MITITFSCAIPPKSAVWRCAEVLRYSTIKLAIRGITDSVVALLYLSKIFRC